MVLGVAGLCEIFDAREKAVVIACMHVFCLACLARWSALKRSCPLCKVRTRASRCMDTTASMCRNVIGHAWRLITLHHTD